MRDEQPTPERPDPPPLPDLSLYSTPALAEALVRELSIRHRKDSLAIIVERDNDGDQPVGFERFVGHSSRLEGMLGSALRYVKKMNDQDRGRWNYRSRGASVE
jgi:hypothetical protein